ncbi:unnamed protein product [Caenorhabditis auriculariae]|uniref:Tyrosine-protein phosphatase domain-containing protein n=1 Tax=Caenorhabditis auriculariae TaxID=2777116 RepID=A0A8S1H4Y8_9PELO|nr:unnamed protein product [Caenorhabditis auriculariae]
MASNFKKNQPEEKKTFFKIIKAMAAVTSNPLPKPSKRTDNKYRKGDEDGSKRARKKKSYCPSAVEAQTIEAVQDKQHSHTQQHPPDTALIFDLKAELAMHAFVNQTLNTGVAALRSEYRVVAQMRINIVATSCQANPTRNRYQDVPCQEQKRVKLDLPNDYIHANYVGTHVNEKRFICTQGPLDNTISDFWQMILQENTDNIIMLCNCIETGKIKCAEYWPQQTGQTMQFGPFSITNLGVIKKCPNIFSVEANIQLTTLLVKKEDKEREVQLFSF